MKLRIMPMILSCALLGTPALLSLGCDKEVSHDKVETKNSDGTGTKTETTVKEKPDGAIEKTTDKKVDNTPDK